MFDSRPVRLTFDWGKTILFNWCRRPLAQKHG